MSRSFLFTFVLAGLMMAVGGAASSAQSNKDPLTGLKLSNDQPIQIESDRLDVREAESVAEFTGNVKVVQGATLLKAGKMVVYYVKGNGGSATTGSAAIDHLVVSDKVYVQSDTQVATGDDATFDMKSQVLVLTGEKVVLSEGDNVAVGKKLTVQMKTGQAHLDGGRISIVIDSKSAKKK